MKLTKHYLLLVTSCLSAVLCTGCDSKSTPKWNLITASNGLVYRINAESGEVSLIAGAQLTKLDELRNEKKDAAKKSYVREWTPQSVKQLGNVTLQLKTTWREGKLRYILTASPYTAQLQKARERSFPEASFIVNLYDSDRFEALSIPIKLSEMTSIVDDSGKPNAITATGSSLFSVETYEALGGAMTGWAGFPKDDLSEPPK